VARVCHSHYHGAHPKYKVQSLSYSKDKYARWLKKGRKPYFGYKVFAVTDSGKGYIDKILVTPANVSECRTFAEVTAGISAKRIYADKGYSSAENRELLKNSGIKNGIMYSAKRNNPLSEMQKLFNRIVSKVRYRVEQAFGTLKRRFSFCRARYFGLEKVRGQCLLKCLAFNLLKAANAC
jgi:IS5 family transposase